MSTEITLNSLEQQVLKRCRIHLGTPSEVALDDKKALEEYDAIPACAKWLFSLEIANEKQKEANELRTLAYHYFEEEKEKLKSTDGA